MQELVSAGEDVLVFYNDKASFNHFIEMMRSERNRMDDSSPLRSVAKILSLQHLSEMRKVLLFVPGTILSWSGSWRVARWGRTCSRRSSVTPSSRSTTSSTWSRTGTPSQRLENILRLGFPFIFLFYANEVESRVHI